MRTVRMLVLALAGLLLSSAAFSSPPAPPPLEAYGDLPGIEDMAISPSGAGLAAVAKLEGQRRLLILDADHNLRTAAPLGDMKLRYIRWVGEDLVLLVTHATQVLGMDFTADKTELLGAILVRADGSKHDMVFANRASLVRAIFGEYGTRFVDGRWIGYFGGIEYARRIDQRYVFDHGRPALFGVDLADNSPRKIAVSAPEGHWRRWLVDGQGMVTAILDITYKTGRWEITNQNRTVLASGIDPTGDVDLISLGKNGDSLIYSVEDQETREVRWFEVSLAGGAPQEVFAGVEIQRIYVDPLNGRLLGYLPDDGERKPILFDAAKQQVLRSIYRAFPKLDVTIQGWSADFRHVLVSTSGNGDSGTWYVVNMAKLSADPVGTERPQIEAEQVGPISNFAYRAGDGLDLDGVLTLPPGREAKNLPVIMLPHGGPSAHDVVAFDWWAQAFASRGYAVFQPNFRGSTNRDEAFRRAGNGQWGRKMQTDISDGLAELARKGIVDPKRACIVGASYGGYAALAGVTLQQGLYRCAIAVAPVSDLADWANTSFRESGKNKMVRHWQRESLGDPRTFAEVSPRRNAAGADAPILLIHGKDDTVVSFNHSSAMADALKNARKPYELVMLREEDHWLSRAATRKQMLEATMAFVQRHNPAD